MSRSRDAAAAGVLLLASAITAGTWWLSLSIQPRTGTFDAPGLSEPATVRFGDHAVPRIFARTEADAMWAQGFVHAGERLWQMQMFNRIARGRLAELFGEPALRTDMMLRTLDFWGTSGRELESVEPGVLHLLEAYAAGVNARVADWRGPWPPEFLLVGSEPEPWSPQASLAITRIMALDLAGWEEELGLIDLRAGLGADLRRALEDWLPDWDPTITQQPLPASAATLVHQPGDRGPPHPDTRLPPDRPLDPTGLLYGIGLRGSNSWALAGSRTADGHPLIANDPHLALTAPSTWYLNSLTAADGYSAVGVSIPGVPGIVIGLNRNVAWTFTNAAADDSDFSAEALGLARRMYRTEGGGWEPLGERVEHIQVRGAGEPYVHSVRSTPRGPLITDLRPGGGVALSMAWTGFEPYGATALYGMGRASSADELDAAARDFALPHQNLVFASTDGDIGFRLVGRLPVREPGALGPTLSSPPKSAGFARGGWTTGYWPADSLPRLKNPDSGYLVSANNLQSAEAAGRINTRYYLPYRAKRIDDLVRDATGWTVEEMRLLQLDSHSLLAAEFRPRAVAAARRAGEERLAQILADWDLRTETDAQGPAPFFAWLFRLRDLIASDELVHPGRLPDLNFHRILTERDPAWIDDSRTPETETLEQLETEAARTAALTAGLRWGQARWEQSSHAMGSVEPLNRLFGLNVGPFPARGGRFTVRVARGFGWAAPGEGAWTWPRVGDAGPSMRFVASMSPDGPRAWFLLPSGQSGNPLDGHYRDMAARWPDSRLIEVSPVSFHTIADPVAAESERADGPVLRLQPTPTTLQRLPG